MAEDTIYITGWLSGTLQEAACDDLEAVGSPALIGWLTSVLGGTPYDLDAVRQQVLPQLPKLFGSAYTVHDYTDLGVAPAPRISHLVPESIEAGGSDVELHVCGTGFCPRSVILFNGGAELTTFLSTTELTTIVSGASAVTPGSYPVQVETDAPGGGLSTGRAFYVLDPDEPTVRRSAGALTWEVPSYV